MPTYLHQILAVDRGIEADTKQTLGEITRIIAVGGDQDPLTGLTRAHKSVNPERWPDKPAETRRVQVTATDLLGAAVKALTRLYDVKYTREDGNARARGTVTVGGEPLLPDVPAGYLLFLEARITELITTVIDRLPVRDPAEEWHTGPDLPRGVWASAPRETLSTARDKQVQVLAEPRVIDGQAFPGNYMPYETDVTTGRWTLTRYSGQLSRRDVQEIRDRAVTVLIAVRYAREQANMAEVTDQHAGAVILGHIFGDLAGVVPSG